MAPKQTSFGKAMTIGLDWTAQNDSIVAMVFEYKSPCKPDSASFNVKISGAFRWRQQLPGKCSVKDMRETMVVEGAIPKSLVDEIARGKRVEIGWLDALTPLDGVAHDGFVEFSERLNWMDANR